MERSVVNTLEINHLLKAALTSDIYNREVYMKAVDRSYLYEDLYDTPIKKIDEEKMTEKEKMQKGVLYDANYDKELISDRKRAKDLCFKYNNTVPSDEKSLKKIIRDLGIKTHGDFSIMAAFYCDYGYNISLGDNFDSNHGLTILDGGKVTFGDNVFIGPGCVFTTAGHPVDRKRRNKGLEYAHPITVGDNVWFGANVTVLPGVTIGSDVVIGAGSVVNKDIPDGVVAFGSPCKAYRKITDKDLENLHEF